MKQSMLRVDWTSSVKSLAPRVQDLSPKDSEILNALYHLSADYPGVEKWFLNKVIPGIERGTRKIIRIERNDQLVAFGIAKLEEGESKICTVRVMPNYVGRGYALKVFDEILEWLKTDRPHLTVGGSRHGNFERIFQHYGFELTSVINGLYLPGKVEYLYNESIRLRHSERDVNRAII